MLKSRFIQEKFDVDVKSLTFLMLMYKFSKKNHDVVVKNLTFLMSIVQVFIRKSRCNCQKFDIFDVNCTSFLWSIVMSMSKV